MLLRMRSRSVTNIDDLKASISLVLCVEMAARRRAVMAQNERRIRYALNKKRRVLKGPGLE